MTPERIPIREQESRKITLASAAGVFLYWVGGIFVGSFGCSWPCRVYREVAVGQGSSASDRSADSVANTHHIFLAGLGTHSGFFAGMAPDQSAGAGPCLLLSSGDTGRCGVELFLLCGHTAHQRCDRDY